MDQEEPDLFERVLGKAAEYGVVKVRRAYGNCDKLSDWEECLRHHNIKAVTNYADGDNAADATLIVDAMDLLHCGTVDGFCIVTSDHLFTVLVQRLRRQEVFVAGIGRRHAPEPLRNALGKLFTAIEDLGLPAGRDYGKGERDMIDRIKTATGKSGGIHPAVGGGGAPRRRRLPRLLPREPDVASQVISRRVRHPGRRIHQ